MKETRSILYCMTFLVLILQSYAQDVGLLKQAPVTEGEPVEVLVAVGLLDIDEINSAEQSFVANFFMELRWVDPRLKHPGPGRMVKDMEDVWNPQLFFVNQQKIWPSLPEVVHIEPDGTVLYRQRVWGPFSQPLDVREFPFDQQHFEIRLASAEYKSGEIVFIPDPERPSVLAESLSLPDWDVLDWTLDFTPYKPTAFSQGAPGFAFVFNARRYASSVMVKIVVPLVLIVLMSGIVFWIDPTHSGTQISCATTSMLTLIAYRFMVGNMLPPVPYLTRMDHFILGSTLLVFAALLQAVLTSIMASRERAALARKFDVWCRFLFIALFAFLMITTLIVDVI